MRYSAFISYNHRDRSWANWLHRQLERYRLPKSVVGRESPLGTLGQRLPPVFQDREDALGNRTLGAMGHVQVDQNSISEWVAAYNKGIRKLYGAKD